ncbi:hypothetical protein [Streptomyces sp. TBY4]|nr:hypothetical protein [Streptomyces sp. TBY4]
MWIVNQKQRRDRLDPWQLAALAELGVDVSPMLPLVHSEHR